MSRLRVLLATLVVAMAACVLPSSSAQAQDYPNRVIKFVVPAGPGGPTDVLARLLAERMATSLGQPVIVENRGGGGGMIGAKTVAAAEPDGYTILLGNTATLANIPAVSKNAGYDPVKNLTGVAKIMDSYMILVVPANSPFKTMKELIAYAKANPGKLNGGAAGAGNLTHLSQELLKVRAGIDFVVVQYKSSAEFLTGMFGDQVQFAVDNVAGLRGFLQEGRIRALAVTSAARQKDFPDVPTMLESGVPNYVVTAFFGVAAPAGTPAPVIAKLNGVINDALRTPEMVERMKRLGAEPTIETSQQFQAFVLGEFQKWKGISDSAGIKVD